MNQTTSLFLHPTASPSDPRSPGSAGRAAASTAAAIGMRPVAAETIQSRFALRVASRLTEGSQTLNPEIGERLRFAREQALERARSARTAAAPGRLVVAASGAALLGRQRAGGQRGWWLKLASVLPVFALVGGLVLIQRWQDNTQVSVAAEIDAALLSDDLPPTAYSDAGFEEFLKNPGQ